MYCKGKKPASREARNPRSWIAKKESPEAQKVTKIRSPETRNFGSLCKQPRSQEARKLGIREATKPESHGGEARKPSQG